MSQTVKLVQRSMTAQELALGHYIVQDGVPESQIYQAEPLAASSPPARPDGWLDGEIELTAFALAHPDCDVKAVLRGFAEWILTGSPPAWEARRQDLLLLLCPNCVEAHIRNTQSISCYCDCHNSTRDEQQWEASRDLILEALLPPPPKEPT